jgi:Uri superfamily endonuclease
VESHKQKWLVDYLVNTSFVETGVIPKNEQLEEKISGMTADDIIQSILKARDIQENLKASSLGRELS